MASGMLLGRQALWVPAKTTRGEPGSRNAGRTWIVLH